jgi:hypothetical protein
MAVDYESQLEGFRDSDARRDDLLAKLIGEMKALETQLSDATYDFENEQKARRELQKQAQDYDSKIAEYQQSANSNNFVVALIDGDGSRVGMSVDRSQTWLTVHSFRMIFTNRGPRVVVRLQRCCIALYRPS